MRKLVLVVFILLILESAFAVQSTGSMKIFAVTSEGEGMAADLILDIEPGDGTVWTSVNPLVGTATQNAERTAIAIARNYVKEAGAYDYKFAINSDATVVDGPSAGAAMTLLAISLLQGKALPKNVSMTGTITTEGEVGGVGGVFEKSKEAARIGIKLFMVPSGSANQIVKLPSGIQNIHLPSYALNEWGLKVVEVRTIDDTLNYAFADIASINIDETPYTKTPPFIPKPISYDPRTDYLHILTATYLEETRQLLSSAREALATTLLDDSGLIDALLEGINEAEQNLKHAELLYDQNYLYSAANNIFVSKVNAMLVKDIAENPSLFSPDATLLEIRLRDLKLKINALKADLNKGIAIDNIEWEIAAEERLSWASVTVDRLLTTQTVAVSTDPNAQSAITLANIQDYEFAVGWYQAARDFHNAGASSAKFVRLDERFMNIADNYIINAENALNALLSTLSEGELADIVRRLDAAKEQKANGFYMGAAVDAASALAFANSIIEAQDKDLNALYEILNGKIKALEEKMSASKHSFVWSNLYLDHAKYYLESADYYYSQTQGSTAVSMLKNGLNLVMLAENVQAVTEEIYDYYSGFGPEKYIARNNIGAQSSLQDSFLIAVIFILVVVWVALAFVLIKHLRQAKTPAKFSSVSAEIRAIKVLEHKLDHALVDGKISEDRYAELMEKYHKRLDELQKPGGKKLLASGFSIKDIRKKPKPQKIIYSRKPAPKAKKSK